MKNLKVSYKIAAAMGLFLAVMLFAMLTLTSAIGKVNDQSKQISENWLPSVRILGELNTQTSDFRIAQLQHVGTTEAGIMRSAETSLADLKAAIDANQAAYEPLIVTDEERQLWEKFTDLWAKYETNHQIFLKKSQANENEAASALLYGDMRDEFNDASAALLADIVLNNEGAAAAENLAEEIYETNQTIAMVIVAGSVVMGIGTVFVLNKGIAKPIQTITRYMSVLQAGDYGQNVPMLGQRDEIGNMAQSVQQFRESLIENRAMTQQQLDETQRKLDQQQRVLDLIREFDITASSAVSSVAAAATELSQAATSISTVAQSTNEATKSAVVASIQTAGTVQAVAASVEQMSASAREISNQVARSAEIAREATTEAEVAKDTSAAMLVATQSIGSVASIIDGIANQITLLALNATIEAVRAGEPGRGFSVVANEIKSLAAQTTAATEKINGQLQHVQGLAEKVSDALAKLGMSVEAVDTVSNSISAAVLQQASATHDISNNMSTAATGVENINFNISDIQKSTESTSSATEQILSSSMMLSQKAENLDSDVRLFLEAIKAA